MEQLAKSVAKAHQNRIEDLNGEVRRCGAQWSRQKSRKHLNRERQGPPVCVRN